jgi:TonB-dependent starch-binding outer membrane protein SusC
VISYVGYATQELRVGNQSTIDVSLSSGSGDLAQVVVVGYGTQNKRDVTGSVKSLKTEDFNRGIINSPQQLLQGKVAGVNVTSASGEPGSIQGITIRGPGGFRTGSTPLFVVDGLPLDNSSTGGGDPLNFINPQDIEAIDVLKDASATAIYGSRGANGVILITTKRGKAGVSNLGLSTSIGVSKIARALPVLSADEFRKAVVAVGGILDDKGGSTDWQDEVTRTAITQNHNLTLSGGTDKLTYYASFGAQRQQGIIKKNQLDRYSGRFNATQKFLEDKLTLEVNLNVANTKNDKPPIQNIIGDAIANNPTYAAYGADGKPAIYQNINNPLIYFDLDKDNTTINRVIGNISPSLKIIKGLVYKLNFGVDNSTGTRHLQALPNAVPQRDGRLESYHTSNRNTLVENYLTYALDFGNHSISALAGHSYQKIFVNGTNTSINRFPISGLEPVYNPGYGQELTLAGNRPGGYAFINELQSFFGRINYDLNNRYLLTANFRADGSSKFGANNKYGYFPSFSFGWKISEEAFMEDLPFSILKLRAGWGKTGNQEIPPKATQALFNSVVAGGFSYPLNPAPPYPAGNVYARLANPFLQWESSVQTNVGLDFGLFNGALSGSVDRFYKTTNNILLEVPPTDPVQPQGTLWANIEDMRILNNGWEVDAEYRHNAGGITYSIGGNLTLIKNNVENSPYSIITSGAASGSGLTSATINGYINGQPIGSYLLREYIGLDNNGVSIYNDVDKDGSISDKDRIVAGTALPNRMYSFYGTAAFKGLDLAVNFNGVAGNKVYDNTANSYFYKAKIAKSVNTTKDAFKEPNESINNAAAVSTRFLKNGAYLRLNNVALGYSLNTSAIGLNRWVKSLRLSITGQNLFVITDYDGYDPEVNTDRAVGGFLSYGIDYLSYPKARSIIFALNVSL